MSLGPTTSTPSRRSFACSNNRYAARCRPTAVLPVPGPPCTISGAGQVGADDLVLVGLDGGDDVAHRADVRAFDLVDDQPAQAGGRRLAGEQLVVEAGHDVVVGEAEPAAPGHLPRIGPAGPVEAGGHVGAPVDDDRFVAVVGDVAAPDVARSWFGAVDAAEEQRGSGVVAELVGPPVQPGDELVVTGAGTGAVGHHLDLCPALAQADVRVVEVVAFGSEFLFGGLLGAHKPTRLFRIGWLPNSFSEAGGGRT